MELQGQVQLQAVKLKDVLLNRYLLEEELGTGGFSQVFKVKDFKTRKHFAMKISGGGSLPPNNEDDEFTNVEIAIREIRCMKKIAKFPGKGKLLCGLLTDWHYLENRIAIIFPCYRSSINDLMDTLDRRPFIWSDVIAIAFQLIHAAKFLHENGMVHLDIKPHNVMLNCADYELIPIHWVESNGGENEDVFQECISLRCPEIKLIDFGSCLSTEDRGKGYFLGVTDEYRPPESLLKMTTTSAYDIWSIGCTILELYDGNPLFKKCPKDVHLVLIQKIIGEIPKSLTTKAKVELPTMTKMMLKIAESHYTLSEIICWGHKDRVNLYDLLSKHLLKPDPEERTPLAQVLDHPFFAETPSLIRNTMEDWESYEVKVGDT